MTRLSRFLVDLVCVPLMLLDVLAQALMRRIVPPRYALLGSCHRCGACCKSLVGDPPRAVKERPLLLRAFIAWHEVAHAFEAYARGPNGEVLFRCGHLQSDNTCGIYWRRPLICRNYPVQPFYETPRLLPDCSYRVAARPVTQMRARASLPIINQHVAVHHPTPQHDGESLPEDYELVESPPSRRLG